jgi:Ni,Fe-hydrogenase I cytochrome b subunit
MTFILILLLFLIPLIFQFNVGSKAVHGYISLKFWKVCIFSYVGLILMTIANFFLTLNRLHETGIRDGMPLIGVLVIGMFFGILNLIIIGIQLYTKLDDK